MTNAKIYGIAMTILDVMTDVFPQEYRDFVFAGLLDPGDVVEMVMFDLIKMTYDKTEENRKLLPWHACLMFDKMVTTKQGETPQTKTNERQVYVMNKTRILLYVLLVIGLIFEAISIVQSFTKNIPTD